MAIPAPGAASPAPPVGSQSPPGTPPAGGAGGMTMPTMNRGLQAAALAQVQWAVRLLEKSLPLIGSGTEPGKDIMKAITALSKHVPPGSTSPGVEQSSLQQMMMQQKQEQPEIARLRAMGGGGAPGGGGGASPPPAAA